MVGRLWSFSSLVLINLIWIVPITSYNYPLCHEGIEYFRDGKCIPCTRCNGSFIVVRPCYIYQDAECAAPSDVISSWSENEKTQQKTSKTNANSQANEVSDDAILLGENVRESKPSKNVKKVPLPDDNLFPKLDSKGKKSDLSKASSNSKTKRKNPCDRSNFHHRHRRKNLKNHKKKNHKHIKCSSNYLNETFVSNEKTSKLNSQGSDVIVEIPNLILSNSSVNDVNITLTENNTNILILNSLSRSKDSNSSKIYFYILLSAIFVVILVFFILIIITFSYVYRNCKKKKLSKYEFEIFNICLYLKQFPKII